MKLKLKNNNYNRYMILFPGWTFDYRIFPEFNYNIIYYDNIDFNKYIKVINDFLNKNKINNVYLLGWSMGNFLINNLILYLKDRIEKIFLISPMEKFDINSINQSKHLLDNDFKKALDKFYRNIFIGDKIKYNFFLENHYNYYINRAKPDIVYSELEFIKKSRLNAENFKNIKVKIIVSEKDIITPYAEAVKLKEKLNKSDLVTVKYTHMPFLYNEVIDEINKG